MSYQTTASGSASASSHPPCPECGKPVEYRQVLKNPYEGGWEPWCPACRWNEGGEASTTEGSGDG